VSLTRLRLLPRRLLQHAWNLNVDRAEAVSRARSRYRVAVRKTFVLEIGCGGLGDNLFNSHLPRLAKQIGRCDRVFVSSRSKFNNPEYRKYIWEANPFVDGFVDEPGFMLRRMQAPPGGNLLDHLMIGARFDDGQRWHDPEIADSFPLVPELRGLTIYDPNFVSNAGAVSAERIARYLEQRGIRPDAQLEPRWNSHPLPSVTRTISSPDFAAFSSILKSVSRVICLTTGTPTLAAALGTPCLVLWGAGVDPIFHHSRRHEYVRIDQ
jgi:hypothetical protein